MKILFIANSGQKYDAARYYLSERRLYNGFVRNGHDVWFFGDREELRALSPLNLRMIGRKRVNEKLLRVLDNFRPDAVFMLNANLIEPQTLARIKRLYPSLPLVQIIYDPVFDAGNRAAWNARLPYVDYHFFTTAGPALAAFSVQGRPCYFIPNMTDRAIDTGTAFALEKPHHDVTCVLGQNSDRIAQEKMLVAIRDALPDLSFCYRGFAGEKGVRGTAYIAMLSNSAMGINLSRSMCHGERSSPESRYLYSSDRIAQLTGNGCLTFIEDIFALQELYRDDEAVFFSGKDDLQEKIRYYADHVTERQAIARKGHEKAHRDFSTDLVTRYMVERVFGQALSTQYAWPVEPVIAA